MALEEVNALVKEDLAQQSAMIEELKSDLASTIRLLHYLDRFSVLGVVEVGGEILMVIELGLTPLRVQDKLVVVNRWSGEWLGQFEVTRSVRGGWLARSVTIRHEGWWSHVTSSARVHSSPEMGDLVAVLMPFEELFDE